MSAVAHNEGFHDDFAAGERTEPVALADETPGTFWNTEN